MDKNENRRFTSKGDIILILCLITVSVMFYFIYAFVTNKGEKTYAEIYQNGNLIKEVELDTNRDISIDEIPQMEFNVKDGAIAVISSNCPDKICMHYGYISKNGQTAVCLPNNVIVKIVADSKSDVDAVIR